MEPEYDNADGESRTALAGRSRRDAGAASPQCAADCRSVPEEYEAYHWE